MFNMACFTPRCKTRPCQQSTSSVLYHCAVNYTRGPLLATLAVQATASSYNQLRSSWLYSSHSLFLVGTILTHVLVYWSLCGLLHYCDYHNTGLRQFKLPRTKSQAPAAALVSGNIRGAVVDSFIAQPVTVWLGYYAFAAMGTDMRAAAPDATHCFVQFFCCSFCNDFLFYWSHRLLHTPLMYRFHKKHHTYTGTVTWASEYTHPVEGVLANTGSTLLAPLLMGVHPLVLWVWLAWRVERACETHSGYCFQGTLMQRAGLLNSEDAKYHDFHHTRNSGNFGVALSMEGHSLWDHCFGTQDAWLQHLGTD